MTDASIASLMQLQSLEELHVVNTKLTRDGILRLVMALPNLRKLRVQLIKYYGSGHDKGIIRYVSASKGVESI